MIDALALSLELVTTTPLPVIAVIGLVWGIFGGALPGISPVIAMALLLPFTYSMMPLHGIVLLVATYIGAEYGGSIPAILIRTPGTNAAAATMIDGYEMTRRGKASEALGIAMTSSFIGALAGLALVVLLTQPLSQLALAFRPTSYFALGILGLSVIATVSGPSLTKGAFAAIIGLMIATVGSDPVTGVGRFTFGNADLFGGVPLLLVMVGLFALSELMEQASMKEVVRPEGKSVRIKLPSLAMHRRLALPNFIGVAIGTFTGVMPGAGGTVASFMAYNEAKRFSRHKDEFGKGSPEGVAAPESANNTDASVGLIPLLSFGIPASNSTAILLGGFLIHGLQPGPVLFSRDPSLLYGLFTGMLVACLALPLVAYVTLGLSLFLVNRPKPYLFAFILVLVLSGAYSINNSPFDLGLLVAAGVLGFAMRYFRVPMLPILLGLVLGYMIESNYRRSLMLSRGDHWVFVQDPISLTFLALAALFLTSALVSRFRKSLARKT